MSYFRGRGLGGTPPPLASGARDNPPPLPAATPPAPAPIPTPDPTSLKSTWDRFNPYAFIKGDWGWPGQVGALAAITGLGYYLYKRRRR